MTDYTPHFHPPVRRYRKLSLPVRSVIFTLLALALFAPGCDVEDEPLPAYLTVNEFKVNSTNTGVHGSVSSKITNASVSLREPGGGKIFKIGTLSLPATVPVLNTGEFEILIDPIIKSSGNSFYLEIYPFYERYTATVTLNANKETQVNPVTTYMEEAKFEFIEDFEGNSHLFERDLDENAATNVVISALDVFEGESSGRIVLDTANSIIGASTKLSFEINPQEAGLIFMEVDYKTDVQVDFGVIAVDAVGTETTKFEFAVLPRDNWNKIYFNMTDLLLTSGQNKFYFALRARLSPETGNMAGAEIYLDNIKVIHF